MWQNENGPCTTYQIFIILNNKQVIEKIFKFVYNFSENPSKFVNLPSQHDAIFCLFGKISTEENYKYDKR